MLRAIITMMDVPTALTQLAPRIRSLSRGGALLVFSCCLLLLGPLAYLWWRFDLASTWDWFGWLLAPQGRAELQSAATAAGADAQLVGLVLLLFGTGFTLLPSAVQIGLSRFVGVPALGFLVKVALGFDLITDWGPIWQLAAGSAWFDATFGWAPLALAGRALAAGVGVVLASVVLQSAVVLVAAGMLTLIGVILLPAHQPGRPIVTHIADS